MDRPDERRKRDADELLLKGYWTSTRAKSVSSTLPTGPSSQPAFTINELTKPTKPTKPTKTLPKLRKDWPPPPVVQDELESLASEILRPEVVEAIPKAYDPPFRGAVDQHPIILESEVSLADAAKLHTKLRSELGAQAKDVASGERRYVLIPRSGTHSPNRDLEDEDLKTTFTEQRRTRRDNKEKPQGNRERDEDPSTPLERRRSRTDLPSLQTKLQPEMPSFRRSTSAFAYTPKSEDSARTARPPSAEFLLSPDAVPYKGQGKGYFDAPPALPRQHSLGSPSVRSGTPLAEKRRSGGSRPTTPILEKGTSSNSEMYGRVKYDVGEKANRAQQISEESGVRRSSRHPSIQSERLDSGENGRSSRKSSNQSSRNNYSSSDEDLADSSDSGRRRRRHHHHNRRHGNTTLHPNGERDRHHRSGSKSARSSVESKPNSRYASPLPSPKVSPSQLPPADMKENLRDNFSSTRDGKRPLSRPVSPLSAYQDNPQSAGSLEASKGAQKRGHKPRSSHSSPVAAPGTRSAGAMPSSTLPILIPSRIDLHSPGESRRSPNIPTYDDDSRPESARPSGTSKPYWQPPQFQPSETQSTHLEQPMGSYRRYSQDIEEGTIAPLPPCPRIVPTRGHFDWLTLPKCPSFNICPSCFESTMAPTEFRHDFVPAPFRSSNEEVVCDFGSQPWYRIAWLLTRKDRRRDLNLIYNLAHVVASSAPCLGKHEALRKWHSIVDPVTKAPIRNFDVCLQCVKIIEVLLPALKGVFVRNDLNGPPGLPRVCDMRFDSRRFVHYFDALETTADVAAKSRRPPETGDFATLAKRFAALPECSQGQILEDARWFVITQLPEFTVCQECFDEVVVPDLEDGKAIPALFNQDMRVIEKASCQLYSPRMREIFGRAVDKSDYKMLAAKARERRLMEATYKKNLEELKRLGLARGVAKAEAAKLERDWRKWE